MYKIKYTNETWIHYAKGITAAFGINLSYRDRGTNYEAKDPWNRQQMARYPSSQDPWTDWMWHKRPLTACSPASINKIHAPKSRSRGGVVGGDSRPAALPAQQQTENRINLLLNAAVWGRAVWCADSDGLATARKGSSSTAGGATEGGQGSLDPHGEMYWGETHLDPTPPPWPLRATTAGST